MEYVSFVPLSYIYFNAGRHYRASASSEQASVAIAPSTPNMHARIIVTSVLHAHVAAPALCVVTVSAFRDVLDHRIVKGALFTSVGGPCPWLSLSLSRSPSAAASVASSFVLSLFAAPLAMLILCGQAAVPPVGHMLSSALAPLIPFCAGACQSVATLPHATLLPAPQLAALLLLYGEVCARLVEAEGSLYVGDVLTTLCLELCYLWSSGVLCCAYARCGLLSRAAARDVAFCAMPKADHHEWAWSPACGAWGVGGLSRVFRAPALALMLAAIHQ